MARTVSLEVEVTVKSLERLFCHILADGGMRCGVNTQRDEKYVTRRFEHEGVQFLTHTLPEIDDALLKGLSTGQWTTPTAFRKRKAEGGLPHFLGGFLGLVFDKHGVLKRDASTEAIRVIRQVSRLAKKLELPYSPSTARAALVDYVACEGHLERLRSQSSSNPWLETAKVGRRLIGLLLHDVPFGDIRGIMRPKHGPGTTAERVRGNQKFLWPSWHRRLSDAGFEFEEFGLASPMNMGLEETPCPRSVEPDEEQPVRVILVPKTAKGPRVIAAEPVVMQYAQQAVAGWMMRAVETNALTKRSVRFTDQMPNRRAAHQGSVDGSIATIDLKSASDLVPFELVKDIFTIAPELWSLMEASRSTCAELPPFRNQLGAMMVRADWERVICEAGFSPTDLAWEASQNPQWEIQHRFLITREGSLKVRNLLKFASQGSALCFPVESIVFFSAVVAALQQFAPSSMSRRSRLIWAADRVNVYGDDITVPADFAPTVIEWLETLGLKVNHSKSFWNGMFRESCGGDFYNGEWVTPVYVREPLSGDRRNPSGTISTVSLANQLYLAGYWGAARYVRELVEAELGHTLPHVREDSSGLGWYSFSNRRTIQRWNRNLHRFEYRGYTVQQRRKADPLSGDPALLASLLRIGSDVDTKHLEETVMRGAIALKRRWIPS